MTKSILVFMGLTLICGRTGSFAQQRIDVPAIALQGSREGLVYDLKHPDAPRRKQAAELIGRYRLREVLSSLMELWQDPDVEVRRAVVTALDNLLDARAGSVLAKMLADGDKDIRQKAIRALVNVYLGQDTTSLNSAVRRVGAVFNPRMDANNYVIEPDVEIAGEAITGLALCLKDSSDGIRKDAAQALGILRGKAVIAEMIKACKSEKEKTVIKEFLRSFAKIGDPLPGPELVAFTRFDDVSVQEEAIFTLGVLREKTALTGLTQIYQGGAAERRKILRIIPASRSDLLCVRSLQALAMIAAPESKGIFAEVLTHIDPRYRQAGAEGLARLNASDLAEDIVAVRLKETNADARMAMTFALFRIGKQEYLEELVTGLVGGSEGAVSYCSELKAAEVPLLYRFLSNENPKLRARVAEILGLIGDLSSIARLEPLTNDKDTQVLAAAVRAQRRIQARFKK